MIKKVGITIVAIVAVAIGVIFYQEKDKNNEKVVRIGAILPLTGGMANYGISQKRGIDIAVGDINAAGGINGVPLEVLFEDSQSDAKTGVSAFNKLSTIDNVPLTFASLTGVILAIQPIADERQVVLVNTSAISPNIRDVANNFLFSLVTDGAAEAIFAAREIQTKHPGENIAVFYSNNTSGMETANTFVKEIKSLGNTNIHMESYEIGTTNFRIQLDKIGKSKAKHVYLIAFTTNEFADILRQAREINLDVQWSSISGVETDETLTLAKNVANGLIYSYPKYNISSDVYAKFQSTYTAEHNSWAALYTVVTYDAVHLIAEAMKKYGTSATDIQQGLRSIRNYNGVFGSVDFSRVGKQYVERELFWKIIEGNQFKVLE